MKKSILLCAIGLFVIGADVGKASTVSQTEKKLVIVEESALSASGYQVADLVNILIERTAFQVELLKTEIAPPAFIAPAPLAFEIDLKGGYLPYKENKRLKTKYHARHLFNPVKRC